MAELTPSRPDDSNVPDDSHDAAPEVALTVEALLALMREGTFEIQREIPWSSNYTFMGTVRRSELVAPVVYKPRRGESPLWDFPGGNLYRREVAAFLVSEALGWHLVPPTVTRKGEFGVGMVQFFIEHDAEAHFFTFRDPWSEPLTRIALFDVIINNADRKGGHILCGSDGRLWAIDHGVTFHSEYKLRTVIWDLAGQPIPDAELETLAAFGNSIAPDAPLTQRLARLLSPDELEALRQRVAALIEAAHFPLPRPGRPHVPWPLV